MIECSEVRADMSAFIDGELSEVESKRMAQHLQLCHSCQLEYTDMKITIAVMHSLALVEPPADFHDRVQQGIIHAKERDQKRLSKWFNPAWLSWGGVAAALLIMVLAGGALVGGGATKLFRGGATHNDMAYQEAMPAEEGEARQQFALALQDEAPQKASVAREKALDSGTAFVEQSREKAATVEQAEPANIKSVNGYSDYQGSRTRSGEGLPALTGDVTVKKEHNQEPKRDGENKAGGGDEAPSIMMAFADVEADEVPPAASRMLSAQAWPAANGGPEIVLVIETEDLQPGARAVERIVREQGLKMQAVFKEDSVEAEILLATPKQKKVMESLAEIGSSIKREDLNLEIDEMLNALIEAENRLLQRHSELEDLLSASSNGEKTDIWQEELLQLNNQLEAVAEKIRETEKNWATTTISLKLIKPNNE